MFNPNSLKVGMLSAVAAGIVIFLILYFILHFRKRYAEKRAQVASC